MSTDQDTIQSPIINILGDDYIPVENASVTIGVTPKEVIQLIKLGALQGRKLDEEWYALEADIRNPIKLQQLEEALVIIAIKTVSVPVKNQRFNIVRFVKGDMPLFYCFWKVYLGGLALHIFFLAVSFFVMLEDNWVDPDPHSVSTTLFYSVIISAFFFIPFATIGTWLSAIKNCDNKAFSIFVVFVTIFVLYKIVDFFNYIL